jgi:PhnB protein
MSTDRPLGLSAHIFVRDPDAAVTFYTAAFGAAEVFRNTTEDGTVAFVELALGPAKLLVGGEVPQLGALGPETIGGTPVLMTLELADVDAAARRAEERGAVVEMPIEEQFWGERYGVIRDPFGHRWALCTRREELTPSDIERETPSRIPPGGT